MALVQSLKNFPWTFEYLATVVLDSIIKEVQWNRRSVFIKDIDNQNRSVSGQVLTKLQDHHSFVRVNGKTFWSCENKTQLVEFFMDEWSKQKPKFCRFKLEGKLIFFHDKS
jgi:hypothetical protein